MKHKQIYFLIIILVSCFTCISGGHAETSDDDIFLLPITKNGKLGYIDTSGNIVIEPKFEYSSDQYKLFNPEMFLFSEGLAAVAINENESKKHLYIVRNAPVWIEENKSLIWGYIDKTGKFIIPPMFTIARNFEDGLAIVSAAWITDGKDMGYINKRLNFVIEPQLYNSKLSANGLVDMQEYDFDLDSYIGRSGIFAIKPHYVILNHYYNGLAVAGKSARKYSPFSLLSFLDPGVKFGYIDRTGEFAIEPQFERCARFSEGLAAVRTDKWGYIDTSGKVVIKPIFDYAGEFSEGLAAVKIGAGNDRIYGYIDKDGRGVIKRQFYTARKFHDGLAVVGIKSTETCCDSFGYIDKTGNVVIGPKYYNANSFINGYAFVEIWDGKNQRKFAWIDKSGNYIWGPTN